MLLRDNAGTRGLRRFLAFLAVALEAPVAPEKLLAMSLLPEGAVSDFSMDCRIFCACSGECQKNQRSDYGNWYPSKASGPLSRIYIVG
jgi:hypothetical protein